MNTSNSTFDLTSYINSCLNCHRICLQTAFPYHIDADGTNLKSDQLRLIMNCAEICQTCANFMLSHSAFCTQLCGVCSVVCDTCAVMCKRFGGMDECAKICSNCAGNCRIAMSNIYWDSNLGKLTLSDSN